MSAPLRPERPALPPSSPLRSCLGLFLGVSVGVACVIGLALLSMGYAAAILGVILAVFGIVAFHYSVWGWWLKEVLTVDEDELDTNS